MATLTNAPSHWIAGSAIQKQKNDSNIYNKWIAFADGQAKNKTLWYMVSMITQGVLFLPVPAVLIYYFNAPMVVLIITLSLFFANIIAGMGGEGIRTLTSLFATSFIVHILMLAIFI
jgi:hypothetical protein